MSILSWLLFGLIAGVLANLLDPAPQEGGFIGAMVLGMLGSLLGGFLSSLIFGMGITGFNFTSFIIAVLGSLLLLFIQRAFSRTA
jgi:uncharacterized membrane protein YeaQ/YmgE (transglycosylase-associated protein family)